MLSEVLIFIYFISIYSKSMKCIAEYSPRGGALTRRSDLPSAGLVKGSQRFLLMIIAVQNEEQNIINTAEKLS